MRLTLNKLLWAAVVLMGLLLGGVYAKVSSRTEASAKKTAADLRNLATQRVGQAVAQYLVQGEAVALHLEAEFKKGNCLGPKTESCLGAELLASADLAEVTFTTGTEVGFDDNGEVLLAPEGRRLVSTWRETPGRASKVCTREVTGSGDSFSARVSCRSPYEFLLPGAPSDTSPGVDPTLDYAFTTPASRGRRGRTIFTDLSYSTLDDTLPEGQRRVVLVYMRGIEDGAGKLVGVVKAGLTEGQLNDLVMTAKVNSAPNDPFRIFIADDQKRLITALGPRDQLEDQNDDLRIRPATLPPEIRAALDHPARLEITADRDAAGEFAVGGESYTVNYHWLDKTWGWRLGIVGPDSFYLHDLDVARRDALQLLVAAFLALFIGGALLLRTIGNVFRKIQRETSRMHEFQFSKTTVRSVFADVRETLHSLEQAKTAVRAMGKYVPLALVQDLFTENVEPALGGNLREVTLLFSDIEGFTSWAEKDPPGQVAQWLGRYLAVMAEAVSAEHGTVDKFIGDAVMAMWNAPRERENHALEACGAALRCKRDTAALFKSAAWGGRPPLVTRIGLHVGSVIVGHFGAPDRLSYTAIGDSVNLASRLESLNKQYGTTLLASEDVVSRAQNRYSFRLIDQVAVKGKHNSVGVYELLGELAAPSVAADVCARYAEGLALYFSGDFARAQLSFLKNPDDPPSRALAARCAQYLLAPPPQPWTGVMTATEK